jgi:hypothetical protein
LIEGLVLEALLETVLEKSGLALKVIDIPDTELTDDF